MKCRENWRRKRKRAAKNLRTSQPTSRLLGALDAARGDGSRVIGYFGQIARVNCDRRCNKAWGISSRPRVQLSANEDDYEFLADNELGRAPSDPGTYEGRDAKPLSPLQFPNRWCVRECERCAMSRPGESHLPLALPSFAKRRPNIQSPGVDERSRL